MNKIWNAKSAEEDLEEIRFMINASSREKGSICPICSLNTLKELSHEPEYKIDLNGKVKYTGKYVNDSPVISDDILFSAKTEQVWINDHIHFCMNCGWWRVVRLRDRMLVKQGFDISGPWRSYQGCTGLLRKFSDLDISLIVHNTRLNIIKQQQAYHYEIDPFVFEEVVNSEIKNFGYETVLTAKTKDGGLDIIGDAGNGKMFGVQVKRTKNTIDVKEIRAVVGALVREGFTHGIVVSTSKFSPSSISEATKEFPQRNYYIELVDGDSFLSSMDISQREMYTSGDELLEYYRYHLKILMAEHNTDETDPDCLIEDSIM